MSLVDIIVTLSSMYRWIVFIMAILFMILLTYLAKKSKKATEHFRATKCFSCESQDYNSGIYRGYPTKCYSCERQDLANNIVRKT